MSTVEERKTEEVVESAEGVSLATLIEYLGPESGAEFFQRIDGDQRQGNRIVGSTVRNSRGGFARAHTTGQAQFVTPGRANGARAQSELLSDSVVIMKMDDLEAVVNAGKKPFSWITEFAPRAGLAAARAMPTVPRGSRGRRQLRA